ncbi:MAG: diacylglycerol kinase [Bacteroidetes bacterium SW_11_45_7]|nr:MAG: diacylglycerol kinase [Bacteroidetes bacterium SW_11_45_7]
MISLIAAASENNVLGKDQDMVWHLPDDFKFFKRQTEGHHIIMGRKTFSYFDKPLPNRTSIVVTRNGHYSLDRADRIYLTRVHATLEGDAFFPAFNESKWKILSEKYHEKDQKHDYPFTIYIMERKNDREESN